MQEQEEAEEGPRFVRDSTHKLKNIADKMTSPKIKDPDTIQIKDFPEVHSFEL